MARTQLNFRLREEQKDRWRDHVDESRYDDTVSDLIKRAVETQIDRDNGDAGDMEIPEVDAASGEVLERLQDMRNDLQDLETGVSQAVDAVHAQQGMDPDLGPELYEALPTGQDDAVTAEDLAHGTGNKVPAVRFALENLRRNTGTVDRVVQVEGEDGAAWVRGDPEGVAGYRTNADPRWFRVD